MAELENRKRVALLEKATVKLQRIDEGKTEDGEERYIFSGPCAEFDVMNDNERYYDKEDYLSHVNGYLKEEIANGLLGELDHSEDYNVSMKAVSHIIRDLWYDEEKKQVWIKIELLDEGDGKIAIGLVKKGVPLYISSRASGYIDDEGNVTLERIYTYDIVYRPGFANAKMTRLNESLHFESERIQVYEWSDKFAINKDTTKSHSKMENFATKEDLDRYTAGITTQVNGLKTMLQPLFEALGGEKGLKSLSAGKIDFSKLAARPIHENKDENGEEKPANEEDENGNGGGTEQPESSATPEPAVTDEMKEKLNEMMESIENGEANQQAVVEFMGMMNDKMTGHGNFMNLIAAFVNKLADFCDAISARVNEIDADYDETMNTVNEMKVMTNLLAGRINENTDYAQLTAKRVNKIHEATNKQTKIANENFAKISKQMKVNERVKGYADKKATNVNESLNLNEDKKDNFEKGSITSRVDEALAAIKNKKIDEKAIILGAQYSFFKHLDESSKAIFADMPDAKKQRVKQLVVESKGGITKSNLGSLINQVNEDDHLGLVLASMPKKIHKVWEGLDAPAKNRIISLFQSREVRNMEEAESLWESLDFGDAPTNVSESVDLTDTIPSMGEGSSLGYSMDDIDSSLGIND